MRPNATKNNDSNANITTFKLSSAYFRDVVFGTDFHYAVMLIPPLTGSRGP